MTLLLDMTNNHDKFHCNLITHSKVMAHKEFGTCEKNTEQMLIVTLDFDPRSRTLHMTCFLESTSIIPSFITIQLLTRKVMDQKGFV